MRHKRKTFFYENLLALFVFFNLCFYNISVFLPVTVLYAIGVSIIMFYTKKN
jgi:hypothetical protein